MDSLNKNLRSAYLTTQAATKESLVLPSDFGSQGAVYHLGYIQHHSVSQSPRQNLFKNSKKAPKGIDKMRIRFIIELWGKVGKEGK